jgi:diguanylate cyclase (GGDEF)-like protein
MGRVSGQGRLAHSGGDEVDVAVDLIELSDGFDGSEGGQVLVNLVDVSERRRYEVQLAFLADHDPLTGLGNRRRLDRELEVHLARCERYGARGALIVLDLDHFKAVNDSLGHEVGDLLLVEVAELLLARLRSTDLVARMGGDEFAILLPEADEEAARLVAQDLVARVGVHGRVPGAARRAVTASVGVVMVPEGAVSTSELLSRADKAMYEAKERGRDGYVLALDLTS